MTATTSRGIPEYSGAPSFFEKHREALAAAAVFLLTVLLTILSFPPYNAPDFAYTLAAPAIFWAYRKPRFKLYAWTMLGAQAVAWTVILGWLHNVTWLGLLLLGPFMGVLTGLWYLLVGIAVPRIHGHKTFIRIIGLAGLAGAWVILEWVRGWFFSGFPWLPLAASQWQRPLILQFASFAGSGGVSFLLIFFNLGLAAYGHRLLMEGHQGLRKRSPEFMVALVALLFPSFLLLQESFSRWRFNQRVAQVALIQPYIPQTLKWDPNQARNVLEVVDKLTTSVAPLHADLIIEPEAVAPWALKYDPNVQPWMESLAKRAGAPILLGTVLVEKMGQSDEAWYNAAVVVDPKTGLRPEYYAKRKLVPFGEYVPLRPVLGWLKKIVPIGDDFRRGDSSAPLSVQIGSQTVKFGPLICYEDIFSDLARLNVLAGADVLVVLTNNGWFGEGGAAYQHAAHSVLRAVETRRPIVRCGNGGWSGWIDEYGYIHDVLKNEAGSIYYRGAAAVTISRDARWQGRLSYYVQNGDWFIGICLAMGAIAYALVRFSPKPQPEPVPADE